MLWSIIFYGTIVVVGITAIVVTIYRIDWARHPEKYEKELEELEQEERLKAAKKKAKAAEKARKRKK